MTRRDLRRRPSFLRDQGRAWMPEIVIWVLAAIILGGAVALITVCGGV